MWKRTALAAVTLGWVVAASADPPGGIAAYGFNRAITVSDHGNIAGFEVFEGSCDSGPQDSPSAYPAIMVQAFGGEGGEFAFRRLPGLAVEAFHLQGTVSPGPGGALAGQNGAARFEVDQVCPPGPSGLVFYFLGAQPDPEGTIVFASRDGNPLLGSATFPGTQSVEVRIVSSGGVVTFEGRPCGGDDGDWVQVAQTDLSDPGAIHGFGVGGSSMGPGESFRAVLESIDGTPPPPFESPLDNAAIAHGNWFQNAVAACAALRSQSGGSSGGYSHEAYYTAVADAIQQEEEILTEAYGTSEKAAPRFGKARAAPGVKALVKARKQFARAVAKAESGKWAPAAKATLKGMNLADAAADGIAALLGAE